MNSVLMWIGGVLVAILTALFAGPYFIDWNGYRGVFEEEATRVLGRQVRVGGDVNLRLLPAPYVKFEKLSIADTSGLTGRPLFSADNFTMWLAVPPLLKGVLEADKIELNRPVVRLAVTNEGQGNWRNFSIRSGSLPFVPAGVALQSVRISDGILGFETENGGNVVEVDKINGELTAKALSGPYSFRGTANIVDGVRQVRLVTTEAGQDGDVRLQASVSGDERRETYRLEGRLSGLSTSPRFDGTIDALYQLPDLGKDVGLAVKSRIVALPEQANFAGIVAAFENLGQPQLVTGDGKLEWSDGQKLVLELSSKWLDLDRLSGQPLPIQSEQHEGAPAGGSDEGVSGPDPSQNNAGAAQSPMAATQMFLKSIAARLPETSAVDANIQIDQVELGRDAVSNVVLHLQRDGGPLRMEPFSARLPGGGRVEFTGAFDGNDESGVGASGNLFVGGPSFARLLRWAYPAHGKAKEISDGPFSVAGEMEIAPESFELKNAKAEFSGIPIRGNLKRVGGEKSSLVVRLDGHELDMRWIGFEPVRLSDLTRNLGIVGGEIGSGPAQEGDEAHKVSGRHWATSIADEIRVDISAGRLVNGELTLKDVDARLNVKNDAMLIPKMRFVTEEGLELELDGGLNQLDKQAKGEIHWVASAATSSALAPLAELFHDGSGGDQNGKWLADMAPFRLAGSLDVGGDAAHPSRARFNADGLVRGARTVVRAELEGGLASWRSSLATVTIDIDSPDDNQVIALLAGLPVQGRQVLNADALQSGSSLMPGRGLFKAVGVPDKDMRAMASLQSERITIIFNGSVGLKSSSDVALGLRSGEMVVAAKDGRHFLNLAGLNVADGAEGVALSGLFDVDRESDAFLLTARDVQVGQSVVAGRVKINSGSSEGSEKLVQQIDADLVVDKASVRGLLSGLVGRRSLEQSMAVAKEITVANKEEKKRVPRDGKRNEIADEQSQELQDVVDIFTDESGIFTDQPFDMSPLDAFRGNISLKVGFLEISPGLVVSAADVAAKISRGKIVVDLTGVAAGDSKLTSNFILRKQLAGVGVAGEIDIDELSLNTIGAHQNRPNREQKGQAQLRAEFTSQALSPRALISVMEGKGVIQLKEAALQGMLPRVVVEAAKVALEDSEITNDKLNDAILARLDSGALPLGTRKIPIVVADGAVRLDPIDVDSKDGKTTAKVNLDITTLNLESEWKIASNRRQGEKAPWPAITVTYQGPVAKIGALKPTVSSGALQRELAVRSLERNVDELERLRKEDEAVGRRQRKRLRQLEQERERARRAREAAERQNDPDGLAVDERDDLSRNLGAAPRPNAGPQAADGASNSDASVEDGDVATDDAASTSQTRRRRNRSARPKRVQRRSYRRSPSAGEIFQNQF